MLLGSERRWNYDFKPNRRLTAGGRGSGGEGEMGRGRDGYRREQAFSRQRPSEGGSEKKEEKMLIIQRQFIWKDGHRVEIH